MSGGTVAALVIGGVVVVGGAVAGVVWWKRKRPAYKPATAADLFAKSGGFKNGGIANPTVLRLAQGSAERRAKVKRAREIAAGVAEPPFAPDASDAEVWAWVQADEAARAGT